MHNEDIYLPVSRITTASAAKEIWKTLKDDDLKASKARAYIEQMLGGFPPWVQGVLDSKGLADKCNLNFQEGKAVVDAALVPFYDLMSTNETLIVTNLSSAIPSYLKLKFASVIEKAFTSTIKKWKGFEFFKQRVTREYVVHGLGLGYFDSPNDFRPNAAGLVDWKIPRDTPADIEQLQYAGVRRRYTVDVLFNYIKDEEVAACAGWNVSAVKKIIKDSIENKTGIEYKDWEQIQSELEQNDLAVGRSRSNTVTLAHLYIKELDGTVSHFIIDDSDNCGEFIFEHPHRFNSMKDVLVIFAYGVGRDGNYHTIRGLGDMIYSIVQTQNRLRCQAYDCANGAASIMIQPEDASGRALEDMSLVQFGPYQILPPGVRIVEKSQPNLAHSVIPIINDMSNVLRHLTGNYSQSHGAANPQRERRELEVQLDAQREAFLSSASVNLFYAPLDNLYEQMFKRLSREDYDSCDPDIEYVLHFRKMLKEHNIPTSVLKEVSEVRASRAVGSGNPEKRTLAFNNAMRFSGSFPEEGRSNLIRDIIATDIGYDNVDRYLPSSDADIREPIDAQLARFESNFMRSRIPSPVTGGHDHMVHLTVHFYDIDGMIMSLQEGQIQPIEALAYFGLIVPHCQEHLSKVVPDEITSSAVAMFTQKLQQTSAMAERLNNEIQAAMQREQEAEQAEMQRQMEAEAARVRQLEEQVAQAEQGGDNTEALKLQKILMETQARMQMEQAAHAQRLAQKEAEFMQKLAFKDLEKAKILNTGGK